MLLGSVLPVVGQTSPVLSIQTEFGVYISAIQLVKTIASRKIAYFKK